MLLDLGGHCYETVREALEWARGESDEPTLLIVHQGWGLTASPTPPTLDPAQETVVDALVERAG